MLVACLTDISSITQVFNIVNRTKIMIVEALATHEDVGPVSSVARLWLLVLVFIAG